MMKFYDVTQNSDEWNELRLGKFTASTFNDLFMMPDKIGYQRAIGKVIYERITGEPYSFYSNKRMDDGHELENLARNEYEIQTFNKVLNGGFYELNEWIGCSPDGRVELNGGVEFKSRDPHIYFEYLDKGILPSSNIWQVYGQLYITGWDWIDYMPYCHPNLKTKIIRIYPNEEKFKMLEIKLDESIKIVKSRIKKYKV